MNGRKREKGDILVVRNINKTIYNKFRKEAMLEHKNVGSALNEAMIYWLKKQEESEKLHLENIMKLKGMVKTNDVVRWSVEVDETLYGETS